MAIIPSDYSRGQLAKEEADERQRPVKLFYQFYNKDDRDAALREIDGDREYGNELFSQLTDFGERVSKTDGSPELALRFREYDRTLLEKIRKYFNDKAGREVVANCNEYIVEADERNREVQDNIRWELTQRESKKPAEGAEATQPAELKKRAEVVPIRPPAEETETGKFWQNEKLG